MGENVRFLYVFGVVNRLFYILFLYSRLSRTVQCKIKASAVGFMWSLLSPLALVSSFCLTR